MQNKKRYEDSFDKHKDTIKSLGWVTSKAQSDRFNELLTDLNLENKSILDIGCGFGDIIPFIKNKTERFDYLGVDQVSDFISVAKNKYRNRSFLVHDYFSVPLPQKFDIVLTSGSLNSNIDNTTEFRKKAIDIMFKHAREAVAFNMSGGYPQPKNNKKWRVHYENSLKILKFCLGLSPKVIFRHNYRKRDFTVIIYK